MVPQPGALAEKEISGGLLCAHLTAVPLDEIVHEGGVMTVGTSGSAHFDCKATCNFVPW